MTDDEILAETGIPSPSDLLRLARVRYLSTLFACHMVVPWGLLQADFPWMELIKHDVSWMWTQLKGASSLQDPCVHFAAWRYLLHYHRPFWKGLARRAGEHAVLQRCNYFVVLQSHQQILATLDEEGLLPAGALQADCALPRGGPVFACMLCSKTMRSKGGEGAHMFKVHGMTNRVRRLFNSSSCPACLKEYHTHGKIEDSSTPCGAMQTPTHWSRSQLQPGGRQWLH